jgi:hypothetical protein
LGIGERTIHHRRSSISLRFRQLRRHPANPNIQLAPREAGNFILPAFPGLILNDFYWRWPERNLAGNTIDFHVQA